MPKPIYTHLPAEKSAVAAWRTAKGLAALAARLSRAGLPTNSANAPRLSLLQDAAAALGRPPAGTQFYATLAKLPQVKAPEPGLLAPASVYRGVSHPGGLQGGSYLSASLHASPAPTQAANYSVFVPPRSPVPRAVSPTTSLVGRYATQPGQQYTTNFGIEAELPSTRYTVGKLKNLWAKLRHLGRDSQTKKLPDYTYETAVRPVDLQEVILNGRVLPANALGRELLRTATLKPGEPLPAGLLQQPLAPPTTALRRLGQLVAEISPTTKPVKLPVTSYGPDFVRRVRQNVSNYFALD